ncbi:MULTISPECIES: Zn-ribbon domain-containing OB-fold protein [Sphingomonas]|nr:MULTISPECIES: Zn-ribbon domain-containing OB-fold protein [Sphingomonas]AGH48680.1 hypothetical protein G432_04765 [Sphingomonas sp. MM-1]MDX3884235.1 Zn-ribbon domain-containing OB-fold protein [Sphingomonas sp.]
MNAEPLAMSGDTNPNPHRPDPIMTVDGAPFWRAANEGRFVAQKCGGCGRLWHPPRAICPDCLSKDRQEQELSGRGTVVSWVMPVHPAAFGFNEPPIVALVEVEEGLRFVTNVEGVPADQMRIGMKVEVGFATTSGGNRIPVFHPAKEA